MVRLLRPALPDTAAPLRARLGHEEDRAGKKAAEKNIYSITEKGRKKLDEWLLKPLRSSYKVKDEFTLRFLFFSKLSPENVLDYLRNQQKKTVVQKESFESTLLSLQDEIDYFLQAIIRKGIIHLEAENQWLDEVMNDIRARIAAPVSQTESSPTR